MAKSLSVGIIGAGPGGLALGIFLKKAGFRDFTIFDREDGVGGTWRINTYPGLACDVKSHLYSFSFDLNATLVAAVVGAARDPGLLRALRRALPARPAPAAEHRGRRRRRWDAESRTWRLTTSTGEEHTFDFVVSAVGLFTQPTMPTLLEEEPFAGTVMHTARWDHSLDLHGQERRRARHRIDCRAIGAGSGQGRQEGLLDPAFADVDPAEAGPASTPTGRSGCSRTSRSPRSSTGPGCGCAASRTSR